MSWVQKIDLRLLELRTLSGYKGRGNNRGRVFISNSTTKSHNIALKQLLEVIEISVSVRKILWIRKLFIRKPLTILELSRKNKFLSYLRKKFYILRGRRWQRRVRPLSPILKKNGYCNVLEITYGGWKKYFRSNQKNSNRS